jgi:hypothetical protein
MLVYYHLSLKHPQQLFGNIVDLYYNFNIDFAYK